MILTNKRVAVNFKKFYSVGQSYNTSIGKTIDQEIETEIQKRVILWLCIQGWDSPCSTFTVK